MPHREDESDDERKDKMNYPELNDDLVRHFYADLKGKVPDTSVIAAKEHMLITRGYPDPHATFWPQNDEPALYLARLSAMVATVEHPSSEESPPQTNQSWRQQKMKAAYDPVYDRARLPQEGLH